MKKSSISKLVILGVFVLIVLTDFAGLANPAIMLGVVVFAFFMTRYWFRSFSPKKMRRR